MVNRTRFCNAGNPSPLHHNPGRARKDFLSANRQNWHVNAKHDGLKTSPPRDRFLRARQFRRSNNFRKCTNSLVILRYFTGEKRFDQHVSASRTGFVWLHREGSSVRKFTNKRRRTSPRPLPQRNPRLRVHTRQ